MNFYPKANILLKDKYDFSFSSLYCELDLLGTPYHQNTDNEKRKENHWFLGESSVIVLEFEKKANIKIISKDEVYLNIHKSKIEKILEETKPKII